MSWYPPPSNATTGLTGIIDALNTGMNGISSVIGGNFFSLSILIPTWFIIFLPLAKFNPEAAFTVASFIATLISFYLMAVGYLNTVVFVLFLVMTFGGLIGFYLHTRQ